MVGLITHLVIVLGLLIGTSTDFKSREVPDWLNFSLIGIGLGLGVLSSVLSWSVRPVLSSIVGLIVGIIIGYVMFYAGQWGGGDSKLIMGLGALFGLNIFAGIQLTTLPLFLLFIINTVLVGAVYGLLWALFVALRDWKKLKKALKETLRERRIIRYRIVVLITTALFIVLAFISPTPLLTISCAIMAFITFFIFYLWLVTKAVEHTCMVKDIPVTKLTEGDWINKDIWLSSPYRSFRAHLEKESQHWLAEKLRYDAVLNLYKQLGLHNHLKKREAFFTKKAATRTEKKLARCVAHLQKETNISKKQLLAALEGKKLLLYALTRKHEHILPLLKESYQYAPDQERISGPADLGISREHIDELKKRRVKLVTVKEGIPFVPSFLAAYLVTMLLGNWLTLLF